MNKHLKIEVNGQEWVNGDFVEISFTDGANGIRIEAKASRPSGGGGGGGLLELLTNASKARTQAVAEEKKAALVDGEPVEVIDLDAVNQS